MGTLSGLYRDNTGTPSGLYRDNTGTIPGHHGDATGTIPGHDLLPVRGAGTSTVALGHCRELGLLWTCYGLAARARRRHEHSRARPLPRVGLADQSCRPELLTVRGAGTRTVARDHRRELGLLWACCGFALSGDWGGPANALE